MNLRRMPIRKQLKVLLPAGILAFGFVAFMLSCSSDSTTAPTEPRAWYYESEFEQDPGLVATPDQVVILDIVPGEESTEHPIPYQYDEGGGHLFAIESDDPFITRAEVFDRSGVLVAAVERSDGGVYLDMTPGDYAVKVYHDGAEVPEEGTVAFIRRQKVEEAQPSEEPGTENTGEETSVIAPDYPAYVALQFTTGDYSGYYLTAVTKEIRNEDLNLEDVKVLRPSPLDTKGDEFAEKHHLFSLKSVASAEYCVGDNYPQFAGTYEFYSWYAVPFVETQQYFTTYFQFDCIWRSDESAACPKSQDKRIWPCCTSMPLFRTMDHNGTLQFPVQDMGNSTFVPWPLTSDYFPCSPMYAAENGYLFYTHYSTSATPDIFKTDPTFRFYRDGTQIKRKDLKKGEVALYEGENYTGVAVVLCASFADTTLIPMEQVQSVAFGVYTDTTVQFFRNTRFSDLIRTVGIDMPYKLDIRVDAIGSIKVFDSKKVLITSEKCPYCNLAGVDLSNLNLDNAYLSNANLMNANMHCSSLKKANLSHALLNGARLPNANLSGASLLGASLNADFGLNLAAATLTGAYLKDVNCKGADLSGADFTNASFHTGLGYDQDGCAQDSDNPPFTNNCASAEGTNMDGTKFNFAYLAGTDFSGATANGASFENAILTGAIFKGAHLDWDSSTGASTSFSGAFIGGANFTNATVESANFVSAYVNFSTNPQDYSIYFNILSAHTQFPGFDDQYGDTPCVWFAYSQHTLVPDTKSGNTCPNGNKGPCDDAAWTSPVIPRDQSPWKNSQGQTQPDWCAKVDFDW